MRHEPKAKIKIDKYGNKDECYTYIGKVDVFSHLLPSKWGLTYGTLFVLRNLVDLYSGGLYSEFYGIL